MKTKVAAFGSIKKGQEFFVYLPGLNTHRAMLKFSDAYARDYQGEWYAMTTGENVLIADK